QTGHHMVNLPEQEKSHWLHIAHEIISHYDLTNPTIEWLAYSHNAVFLVTPITDETHPYILRIHQPDSIEQSKLESELHWLTYLKTQNLTVSIPVPTTSGANSVDVNHQGNVYTGALFHYLRGNTIQPEKLNPTTTQHIGEFIAHMHIAAQHFTPPENFNRHTLDYEGLFGESGIYHPGDAINIFTDEQRHIMDAARDRIKKIMESIGRNKDHFGMIHGDMLLKNILIHDNTIRALDFEYCGYGYFLYDLTPLLWQMKTDADRYDTLEAALWQGYTKIRPVAAEDYQHLESFIVARQIASLRWLAQNLHNPAVKDVAPKLIQQRITELEAFLATGKLKRASVTS
ncbi:MAG: phosphotransferase enzyme family protein, partial [Aggregatilineales bacterium]